MSSLVKIAGNPRAASELRELVSSCRDEYRELGHEKVAAILGRIAAAPVRAVGRKVLNVLLGPVAKAGPFKGARMARLPGKAGWQSISKGEFQAIQAGRTPGRAVRVDAKGGPGYFREVYGRGGLVGAAQRNPGKAALGVGGSYLLATSPAAREMAKGFLPSKRENPVAPEVEQMFAGPAAPPVNPIARTDWKPTSLTVTK